MAAVAVEAPGPDPTLDVDLAAVLEALPDGVVVIDPDIRVVWVNARFRALTGWTLAELVGRSGLELLDPEQLTAALDALSIVREAPACSRRAPTAWPTATAAT
jgi:PAS domain S-box-containing protein